MYIASTPAREQEISLVELGSVIFRHKGMLVAGFLLCLLPAILYLFLAHPVYQATVHLLPPRQTDIQGLIVEIDKENTQVYTPETVYTAFLENLESPGLRRDFFVSNKLVDHYSKADNGEEVNVDRLFSESFNSNIQVQEDIEESAFVSVSFKDKDPDFAARLLNRLIDFADKRTVGQLVGDVNARVKSQITAIQHEITGRRQTTETSVRDTIARLQESRSIAAALGMEDASSFAMLSDATRARLAINTAQLPMYMRGVKALDAEIEALKSRESIDPFVNGLRALQERLALLKAISIDGDFLSAVTVDDAARPPYRPVSPRYALILLFAVLMGMMLGTVMAFIAEIVRGKKGRPAKRAASANADNADMR